MRLALAYLVSQYPAISHTFILREIRELRAHGLDVHVASINPADRPLERLTAMEREEAERTYVVKHTPLARVAVALLATFARRPLGLLRGLAYALTLPRGAPGPTLYGVFYLVEAVLVGRWMAACGVDHLHVHFATPAATVALIATRIFPVTFSITVHGPDEFYDTRGLYLAEKIRAASFLCCIGHFARSQLMLLSSPVDWPKLELAPLGVDPTAFTPAPFRERPAPYQILSVGRLVPQKGQHVLLAAVAQLVRRGRDVRLGLVGDGPQRPALEAAIRALGLSAHVVLHGAVDQERIRALYAQADVFVLASFAEGVPVVLMEAMAMELACIAPRIAGIPELIRNGIDGLLVPPGDEAALADTLEWLLDDAPGRRVLGQSGRERVLERYDLARNTAHLADVFVRRLARAA